MNLTHLTQRLEQGLARMGLSLESQTINTLLAYLQELHKWNQAYNLSAIRQPEAMVTTHLLDSLSLLPILQKKIQQEQSVNKIIDVGTGAGLPGIPLAICLSDISVTLLDSNGKKTRFLFQTAHKLGLNNIEIVNERVEKFHPEQKFSIMTSRAFASINDIVNSGKHLLKEDGEYWAMKGIYPEEELTALKTARLKESIPLNIPHLEGERHLLILVPISITKN